jgi:putative flippase GtrA
MIIMGLAAFIAVTAVLWLLGTPFWAALAIGVICALVAQFVTGRQMGA